MTIHELKFEITYKPAKGRQYTPKWLVCESCYENRKCFGSDDVIESVKVIA